MVCALNGVCALNEAEAEPHVACTLGVEVVRIVQPCRVDSRCTGRWQKTDRNEEGVEAILV